MATTYMEYEEKVKTNYSKAYQKMLNDVYKQHPNSKESIKRNKGLDIDYVEDMVEISYQEISSNSTQSEFDKTVNKVVKDLLAVAKANTLKVVHDGV